MRVVAWGGLRLRAGERPVLVGLAVYQVWVVVPGNLQVHLAPLIGWELADFLFLLGPQSHPEIGVKFFCCLFNL